MSKAGKGPVPTPELESLAGLRLWPSVSNGPRPGWPIEGSFVPFGSGDLGVGHADPGIDALGDVGAVIVVLLVLQLRGFDSGLQVIAPVELDTERVRTSS